MCKYEIVRVTPDGSRQSISTNNETIVLAWVEANEPGVTIFITEKRELNADDVAAMF
jgi:hypothetical protein